MHLHFSSRESQNEALRSSFCYSIGHTLGLCSSPSKNIEQQFKNRRHSCLTRQTCHFRPQLALGTLTTLVSSASRDQKRHLCKFNLFTRSIPVYSHHSESSIQTLIVRVGFLVYKAQFLHKYSTAPYNILNEFTILIKDSNLK